MIKPLMSSLQGELVSFPQVPGREEWLLSPFIDTDAWAGEQKP